MKIGPLESKPPVQPVGTERAAAKAAEQAAQAQQEASAKVELSETASTLSNDGAEFDAQKVAQLAAAIRENRFVVHADVIADKLIANAAEFIGRQH